MKKSEIEKLAKLYAGFPEDKEIDDDERYYQTHKCQLYDAFLAGANIILNPTNSNKQDNKSTL